MSKTSTDVKNRWNKKHYDRMRVLVPKGRGDTIREFARERNVSVNGLINDLLRYDLGLTPHEWKAHVEE